MFDGVSLKKCLEFVVQMKGVYVVFLDGLPVDECL